MEALRVPLPAVGRAALAAMFVTGGADGLLDPSLIREAWSRHLHGQEDLQYVLWPVLMLQAWRGR